jgi:hypothetical protein
MYGKWGIDNKMLEIEKMYENAGIRLIHINACKIDETEKNSKCNTFFYPDFTAEKQIELIKWLAFRDYITIVAYMDGEYHSEHDKYNTNEKSLKGCLARLINNLWQDLTDEEKEQIKEILK